MGKLVVFKLGEGSFEQGFPVTLQIAEDGDSVKAGGFASRPCVEMTGRLPAAPEIPECYTHWQSCYHRLGLRLRLSAPANQVANVSLLADCSASAQGLSDRLNAWLNALSLRAVKEKLLEKLLPSEQVRVIFQTEDKQLQRLPWHLWDFFERYPQAEVALSASAYERLETRSFSRTKVRILAILGNSQGINIQADRTLLERLPGAEVTFLIEPQLKELNDQLWEQGWDILFFAGHSSSQGKDELGRIYLNQIESLSLNQLKYALKKAIEQGLKLAIFNSCDGLGLARNLAELHIPQLIVMREPVPDQVAQEFLKYFLQAFARGESFYLAVRLARQRLQGLENEFPCATWLPVIYQNPAAMPPTWAELVGQRDRQDLHEQRLTWRSLRTILLISLVVTSFLIGIRRLGMLQPLELQAFDQLLRLRPDEVPDPRLLVVKVTEADIQAQNPEQRQGSLSDEALAQLLQKLEPYQPQAIGLDIYHDLPVGRDHADLANRLAHNHQLIGVCKGSDAGTGDPGVGPSPDISVDRLGFSDVVVDSDGILRRHLLALTPDPASPCTTSYAFSVQLAFRYLAAKGILPKFTPEGYLQLGSAIFKPLDAHTGGYQGIDAWGHQVLLNYRSYRTPEAIAPQVKLTDVLTGKLNPNSVKDRIVLIGTTAESFHDHLATPYQEMSGVLVQAQMVSQILSTVLDQRPLLSAWPQGSEALWVWAWACLGGIATSWNLRSPWRLGLTTITALGALYGFCFYLLIQGAWVPLVPSALALGMTSASVVVYRFRSNNSNQYLDGK